jgi:MFS family permease
VSAELGDYERRLRRAGLPLLIEDYSAREDVFNRAIPFLALVFLAELGSASNLEWSLWANVAAVLVGLVVLLAPIAALNVHRGRRWYALPERVGYTELAIFVLVPPLLPLIGGGQVGSAALTIVGNVLLLVLVYVVVGYGLLSILRWAVTRVFGQLASALTMLARAIPLLLFFALVLFINAEMWQVFGGIDDGDLIGVIALFVGLGCVFLVVRLPGEVRHLEDAEHVEPRLSRRQRLNVGLVMFVSYALQTLIVSLAVAVFFVLFGLLTISDAVTQAWIGTDGDAVWTIGGATITAELLRVSAAIAAFSGLYYSIAVLTDATYRTEFLGDFERSMRQTFALRAEYLGAFRRRPAGDHQVVEQSGG